MQNQIFEYYNNTVLCVNQDVFLDLNLLSYSQFQKWCQREKITRVRTAGNGRTGLIRWDSIPDDELAKIKAAYGDPYSKDDVNSFISRLENDEDAAVFYQKYQDENGNHLLDEKQYQHYIESQILNAYGKLILEIEAKSRRNSGFKKTKAKRDLSNVINELKTVKFPNSNKPKFPHNLPSNPRALERRFKEYNEEGYDRLIHKGRGNSNTKKIKGDIAEWILANYCLPNKPSTTDVHRDYMKMRDAKDWPTLTEKAIYIWLQDTAQKKVWVLARHGKDEFIRQFGHKVSRDKSDWFPYCYIGIDGTKLDWIHYKESSPIKMGADLKIDVVFDVYSEKIIGWNFSQEHENHTHHFNAFKMAIQEAGVKPILITYDNQGGHKTPIMQELYDKLVSSNGGEHYPHRALEHGSPVEQLFSRFQQEILNKWWFSDKQAVNAIKADSRPNMEFVKRFKHKLHHPEEMKEFFAYSVEKWNKEVHPLFKEQKECRNQVAEHPMTYDLDKVDQLEMMHLFWITSKDAITYQRDGLKQTVSNKDYHFEVYDAEGHVDLDFRDKYTGCKFFVQYDPDHMDNYVRLYLKLPNGDRRYVADAEPIKKVKNIPALMNDQDRGRKHKMISVRDKELDRTMERLEALRHKTNITEESLIQDQELELKFKGRIPKEQRTLAESGAGAWLNKL